MQLLPGCLVYPGGFLRNRREGGREKHSLKRAEENFEAKSHASREFIYLGFHHSVLGLLAVSGEYYRPAQSSES